MNFVINNKWKRRQKGNLYQNDDNRLADQIDILWRIFLLSFVKKSLTVSFSSKEPVKYQMKTEERIVYGHMQVVEF